MAADALDFVHRFVSAAKRANAGTLLLLHGTGGDESDLLPLGGMLTYEEAAQFWLGEKRKSHDDSSHSSCPSYGS